MKAFIREYLVIALIPSIWACAPSPIEVATQFDAAWRAKNVDAAMQLVAPNAVFSVARVQHTGPAEIRTLLTEAIGQNKVAEVVGQRSSSGNTVTWIERVTADLTTAMGLTSLDANVTMVVESGKVASYVWALTPESLTRLQAANNQRLTRLAKDLTAKLNARDASAAGLLTPNATIRWLDQTFAGEDGVKEWLKSLAAEDAALEPEGEPSVKGPQVNWPAKLLLKSWRDQKVGPLTVAVDLSVVDSRVSSYVMQLTPDSAEKLKGVSGKTAATSKGSKKR